MKDPHHHINIPHSSRSHVSQAKQSCTVSHWSLTERAEAEVTKHVGRNHAEPTTRHTRAVQHRVKNKQQQTATQSLSPTPLMRVSTKPHPEPLPSTSHPREKKKEKKSKPGGRESHPDCTVFTDRRDASKASPRTNTSHPTTAKLASRPHLFAFAYTLARAQLAGCTTWRGLQPVSHLAR